MENTNINNLINMFSVSSDDNVEIDPGTFLDDNGNAELKTVSGNDVFESTPTNVYIINTLQEDTEKDLETTVEQEETYTLFNKPLEQYSPTEGFLLILTVLCVIVFIYHIVKGGFSWLSW